MESPAIPFRVRVVPSRVAPAAFMTISEGAASGRAWPMVFGSGSWGGGAVCAMTNPGASASAKPAAQTSLSMFFLLRFGTGRSQARARRIGIGRGPRSAP